VRNREWPAFLTEIIAHELAHYEQFRDGRKLQERGIAVRTRTLVQEIRTRSKTLHP
jgi:predicted SprT family Zn-dependent metalloprotease